MSITEYIGLDISHIGYLVGKAYFSRSALEGQKPITRKERREM